MIRHTLKILQYLLQDFKSVTDYSLKLRIKRFKVNNNGNTKTSVDIALVSSFMTLNMYLPTSHTRF